MNVANEKILCDNAGAETLALQQPFQKKGDLVRQVLENHLTDMLDLPRDASSWLLGLWDVIQFVDDVADGDDVSRQDLNNALNQMLVAMPSNRFFLTYASELTPVVAVQILKWQASDWAETNNQADERSYMWRAGFYDVVLLVVQLCHGHDVAVDRSFLVMSLYGETMIDYKKEFANA
tara:strand:+ start:20 stop:553 length:534 start_codon:yes stop_codon:yes gene_type:complete